MKFFIIAIDHGWQLVPPGAEGQEHEQLRTILTQAIVELKVSLICEESDPCRLSIAQQVAYTQNPRIAWKNINMTAQERLEAGIWEVLFNREPVEYQNDEATGLTHGIYERIPEDDIREDFFAQQAIQSATTDGTNSALILCGDLHADALREKLRACGYEADVTHELVPVKYWR